jgi:hypothetical protein
LEKQTPATAINGTDRRSGERVVNAAFGGYLRAVVGSRSWNARKWRGSSTAVHHFRD